MFCAMIFSPSTPSGFLLNSSWRTTGGTSPRVTRRRYGARKHLRSWKCVCVGEISHYGHVCLQEHRHAEFVEMKRQITALMEDLEQLPDGTFEKDAVCEDEEAFCLSLENINSLKVLLQQVHSTHTLDNNCCRLTTRSSSRGSLSCCQIC